VKRTPFGVMPDGSPVELFTFRNAGGTEVAATNYGGIIVSLLVRDRTGVPGDVVLGFDSLDEYLDHSPYFGAIVGRYANRIRGGRFTLDGAAVQLATNNGPNHLHGGIRGFDKVVWQAQPLATPEGSGIALFHVSPAGDEGYPGRLELRVRYLLSEADELVVDFEATSDAPTPVNLTQHSYFNLAGAGRGDILGHELTLQADRFTPVDEALIPTGALAPVAETPLDFRARTSIGARIDAGHPQLRFGGGYDHNYVVRRTGPGLVPAARVEEPDSGRSLEVRTTEPGLQLYTGNSLGALAGKQGSRYGRRSGLCLETQHFPDSPNQPAFPDTILRPGRRYRSRTVFAFGVTG